MLLTQLDLLLEQLLPRSVYDLPSQIIGTLFGYYNYFSQFLLYVPFYKEAESTITTSLQNLPVIGGFFIPKPIAPPPPPAGAMELVLRRVDRLTGNRSRTSFIAGMGFAGFSAGLYFTGKSIWAYQTVHQRRNNRGQTDEEAGRRERKRPTIHRPHSPSSFILSSVPSSAFGDNSSASEEDYNASEPTDSPIYDTGSWALLMPSQHDEQTTPTPRRTGSTGSRRSSRSTRTKRTRPTTEQTHFSNPRKNDPMTTTTTDRDSFPIENDTTTTTMTDDQDYFSRMPTTFPTTFSWPKFWWTSYLI